MEQTGVFPKNGRQHDPCREGAGVIVQGNGRKAGGSITGRSTRCSARSRERSCIRNFWGSCRSFWFCRFFFVIMPTLEPLLGEMELPRFTRFSHGGQYISEGMVVSYYGFHVHCGQRSGNAREKNGGSGCFLTKSVSEASSGWKAPAVGLYLPVC